MPTDLTKNVVVLRTGHLVYFEWACHALTEAGVPYFSQEETSGGLRLAMPATPATGPGISWAVLVPEQAVPDAQSVLAELPFEVRTEAGIWDFQPKPKVKLGWKIYTIALLAVILGGLVVNVIRELGLHK